MNEIDFILDIIKYALAGLIVFFTGWVFIKAYLSEKLNFQRLELKKAGLKHTLPLRLQAYERTVLFLERVNPSSMLIRLHTPGMSAREMQAIVISDIRAEYQHNISQQIYVSNRAWAAVKQIREDTISMINSAANALPENALAVDLSRAVLTHLANLENENPYDLALNIVKSDMQSLF
ncbi:MAG: hypothetical protein WC220_07800 [Pedobacter sp.]|jgi:hypothetical protein